MRPQDFLTGRIRVSPAAFPRRKSCNYGNSFSNQTRSNRKPQPAVRFEKPDRRRRASSEPAISKRSTPDDLRSPGSSSDDLSEGSLVMEKVTILRRGESLDSKLRSGVPSRKEVSPKQGRLEVRSTVYADMYAGSAFAVSPEPSSLPLPSFSRKKHVSIDDSATRDLRRLLRLD